MSIQWLFIGGPWHGTTQWAQDDRVRMRLCAGGGRNQVEYVGGHWLFNGRLFRVGYIDPGDLLPSTVNRLIEQTGLRNFAGPRLPEPEKETA